MKRIFRKILPIFVIALSLCLFGCAKTMTIGGEKIPLDQTALDLRSLEMTTAEFDKLQKSAPDCDIHWSVPVGNQRVDSDSAELSLSTFTQDELAALSYFPLLQKVEIGSDQDYDAIQTAIQQFPSCSFVWQTSVAGLNVSSGETALDLSGKTIDLTELQHALSVLPSLETLNLFDTGLDAASVSALKEGFPTLDIQSGVTIGGETFSNDAKTIDLTAHAAGEYEQLLQALPSFSKLEEVNLTGWAITDEQKATLREAAPDCFFLWEVEFPFGLRVTSDVTELDLREYTVEDPVSLIEKLKLLPKLTFLDLSDCGLTDEQNASVRDALPDTKVVWMLHLLYWDIRTDITAFSMGYRSRSPFPDGKGWYTNVGGKFSYKRLTTESIEPLKYCTDLVALDIGHAEVYDLTAISGCTKLKYLVIALMDIEDISPLKNLPNLVYIEAFYNMLDDDDLDVFLGMKNLKYLNVGGNDIYDIDVLKQLTNLERLWVNWAFLTDEEAEELKAALPNTLVHVNRYMDPGGNGWPNGNPGYEEMRALFGFKY